MRLEKDVAPFRAGDIQDILAAGRTRLRPYRPRNTSPTLGWHLDANAWTVEDR